MDYEGLKYMNDDVHEVNKGNFHSDTEVLQAGLTKFVIEENLEVQLRFDGLDEAHILLGESGHCEDHWGSGFRRQKQHLQNLCKMLLNSIQQDEINLTTEGNLFGPNIDMWTSSSVSIAQRKHFFLILSFESM